MKEYLIAWLLTASPVPLLLADESVQPTLAPEEQVLADKATMLSSAAVELYQQGRPLEAIKRVREALEIRRQIYTASKYADGHADLALSLSDLGTMLKALGAYAEAKPHFAQALDMYRKLYPESQYPDGHLNLAIALDNLGGLLWVQGAYEKASPHLEQSVAVVRKLFPAAKYPNGHPNLAISLSNLGQLLRIRGMHEKSLPYFEQALDIHRKHYPESKFPDGHPHLAIGLNNLGGVLLDQGAYAQALAYFEQSLTMRRRLYPETKYPNGHPSLVNSLQNVALALDSLGTYERALPYYTQALAMDRRLYPESKFPDGHPQTARSLQNLGAVMQYLEQHEKALAFSEQALAMRRQLYPTSKYPDGHPELSSSLNSVGFVLTDLGRPDKAVAHHEEALAMQRKLYPAAKYPDGHHELANSLNNWAVTLFANGDHEMALASFEQSLAMHRKMIEREIGAASEAQALTLIAALPNAQHGYYSAATFVPGSGAASYDAVWFRKGTVMSLLTQRHLAAAVHRVESPQNQRKFAQLREVRGEFARLLRAANRSPEERDKELVNLTEERDRLERDLAKQIPALESSRQLAGLRPDALTARLAKGTVFIDLARYNHMDKNRFSGWRYLAFVLAPDRRVQRIALGDAKIIDEAITSWRRAIQARQENDAPARLRELIWDKLAPHLPAGTKTLYVSAEGDMARLPWSALPTSKNRVLLEDFEVAVVPHGRFLLEQLLSPTKTSTEGGMLAIGGIDYGPGVWPALPGTATELAALRPLVSGAFTAFTKTDSTAHQLTEALPKARYAHLATHGFFDADSLSAEKKRESEARRNRQFGDTTRQVAVKNPLGFVGLVLARGEILTGLNVVDLPLENLQLVTLSACETGLGETTGGKGVENLQQAFHLAGCPNVIASLWNVNDAATAALMAKFYHELWANKRPAIEALRIAQLTIYRHPELIPDLAGERGAPRLKEAIAVKVDPSAKQQATADTKLWAAFVLSGVGRR